ncbi:MAG TPA: undecaprenyldiphospho-muramoylpentapeptide beta-N-acetylglucosaminyltransferase [Candidatus Polarisedimenticolaceae bacterium]|nr:undecaprenyldiphospho-muramoylpentapeptide beta-N-acetylglucosaminyltransferase [Candidatus Polarisedimenticolaceae bacterium]
MWNEENQFSGRPQIVFAGGGTAGHVFPALAVADEMRRRHPQASIRFIGAKRGLEQRLVPRAGYRLRSLGVAGIQGRGPVGKLVAGASAGWAVVRCLLWLLASKPDLVIGVGGYASGPAVLAATLLRRKTMVMEQNHYPGATNRWLAPRVDAVCVPSAAARLRMGDRGIVTGNPVRREFAEIGDPPLGAVPSVLVFGGSRGARSINDAMIGAAGPLARHPTPPRLVVQTGRDDAERVGRAFADYPRDLCSVVEFIDDMPGRLASADLVVCRAGASTLSELAVAGRASILVPYPFAADDHQRHNAESMRDAGAARMIVDAELDGERLARALLELCADHERLRAMGRAARSLGRPRATVAIADVADRLMRGLDPERAADVP